MENILDLANSWGLWICGLATIVLVCLQNGLFMRLAKKEAQKINFDSKNLSKSFRIGIVTTIGPAVAGLVVLVGMVGIIGMPITWMRLSIIGAASTELTAATVGVESAGMVFAAGNLTPKVLSLAFFTMGINVTGWLLFTAIFTHKMGDLIEKIGGGDMKWMNLITASAGIGVFSQLAASRCIAGADLMVAALSSTITMIIFAKFFNPKIKGLAQWNLAIGMLVAMVAGTIVKNLMG